MGAKSTPADKAGKESPHGAGRSSFDLIDSAAFFKQFPLKKGSAFLDIACGRGAYTLIAADFIGPAGKLYAVDLWQEGIAGLKGEAAARGIKNIVAKVADVGSRIPLADGSVDAALMATVLHDLVEEGKAEPALRETARVLRPGGLFAVVEFKKVEGPPGPPREVRLNRREVENLVTPFGFESLKARSLGQDIYLVVFRIGEGRSREGGNKSAKP